MSAPRDERPRPAAGPSGSSTPDRPEPDHAAPSDGRAFERGTAVAARGRALLIVGPSGAGKSSLALELVSRGARLVADDGVLVEPGPNGPWVSAPPGAGGRIEARGVGILRAPRAPRARLVALVDLSREEEHRLPPERRVAFHGASVRLFHGVRSPPFAAALLLYLLHDAE